MQIIFYQNTAETIRLDKTAFLTELMNMSGTLRDTTSIINPVITIQLNGMPEFNYAYIPEFKRYYYVSNIVSVRNDLWEIYMQVDVLMSYKNEISQNKAFIDRNEEVQTPYLIDKRRVILDGYDITDTEVNMTFFESGTSYVLNGFMIDAVEE